jgi:hypothetical protein
MTPIAYVDAHARPRDCLVSVRKREPSRRVRYDWVRWARHDQDDKSNRDRDQTVPYGTGSRLDAIQAINCLDTIISSYGGCYDIRRKLLADGGLLIKNGVVGIFARGTRIFGAVSAYGPTDYRKR